MLLPLSHLASTHAYPQLPFAYQQPLPTTLGQVKFSWFGIPLYRATLWHSQPQFSWQAPFALGLQYRMSFGADLLISSSVSEMERQGTWQPSWQAELTALLPSVQSKDELLAVYHPTQGLRLYKNGSAHATTTNTAFARAFLGIWLDPTSRKPTLTQQLKGLN